MIKNHFTYLYYAPIFVAITLIAIWPDDLGLVIPMSFIALSFSFGLFKSNQIIFLTVLPDSLKGKKLEQGLPKKINIKFKDITETYINIDSRHSSCTLILETDVNQKTVVALGRSKNLSQTNQNFIKRLIDQGVTISYKGNSKNDFTKLKIYFPEVKLSKS